MSSRTRTIVSLLPLVVAALLIGACAGPDLRSASSLPGGAGYVAMGSSFASGPGITSPADATATRCARSRDNYAHQLATLRGLALTDVSCAGATTQHLLQRWNEQPPQLDALTPDTRLVTVTIGGNDVGYIGRLMADACSGIANTPAHSAQPMCQATTKFLAAADEHTRDLVLKPVEEHAWRELGTRFDDFIREVHRRSPSARLVFVDYLTVIGTDAPCDQAPLSRQAAQSINGISGRLARVVAEAAKRGGAEVLRASALSRNHGACAAQPWVTGIVKPANATAFAPFHPNLAGMTAIAAELDRQLGR